MKRVLVANDDGIFAPGIRILKEELAKNFDVYTIAPDRERSASGYSISLDNPIRVKEIEEGRTFAIDGTPVDAVYIALHGAMKADIDIVVSGINKGLNVGTDVFYSGTVSSAFQAVLFNKPGIAVSIDIAGKDIHYETAAMIASRLLENIDDILTEPGIVLNVNVPNVSIGEIKGIDVTTLGRRIYRDRIIERVDPKNNKYYWIDGVHVKDVYREGTDVTSILNKRVSLTPLRLDITDYNYVDKMKQKNYDKIIENILSKI